MPFDKIIDAVKNGDADAGLLIHEGQLFYNQMGLHKVLDLGEWWYEKIGPSAAHGRQRYPPRSWERPEREVSKHLHRSIQYSLDNREDALASRCSSPGTWSPRWPTALLQWGSTTSPLTTATEAAKPFAGSSTQAIRQVIPNKVKVEFVDWG